MNARPLELRDIIDHGRLHADNCAALRRKYGTPVASRAVINLQNYVEFDEARVVSEIKAATANKARELHLMIDSPGGASTAGHRIIGALDAFKGKKRGIVVGQCSSMATVILAACNVRVGPPTADFLIHCPGWYEGDTRYAPPRHPSTKRRRDWPDQAPRFRLSMTG